MATPEAPAKRQVFLSYQWDHQPQIKVLHDKLKEAGFDVWLDINHMTAGQNLHAEIAKGIKESKVIVCCVTKRYAASKNCENEMSYCYDTNKQIIVNMLENVSIEDLGGIGFKMARLLRVNAFDDKESMDDWSGPKYTELLTAITTIMDGKAPEPAVVAPTPAKPAAKPAAKNKPKEIKDNDNNDFDDFNSDLSDGENSDIESYY